MSMKSGGSSSGSVSRAAPWYAQQPYVKNLYARAEGLWRKPMTLYPGSTIAEQSPYTQAGLESVWGAANSGLTPAATDLAKQTLRGDFLGGNPYLDRMYGRAAEQLGEQYQTSVVPGIESRFGGSGRTRSGAYEYARGAAMGELGESLSSLAERMYGGAYEAERGRQMSTLGMVPGLSEAQYGPAAKLLTAGKVQEAYDQSKIDELIKRFEYPQREPWERLGMFQRMIGDIVPGTTVTEGYTDVTENIGRSLLQSLAGI